MFIITPDLSTTQEVRWLLINTSLQSITMLKVMNYSFSISILILLQKDSMAQPLDSASLLSSIVTHEIRLQEGGGKQREKDLQKLKNKERKRRECDRKRRE